MGNEEKQNKVLGEGKGKYRVIGTRPVRPDGVDKVTGKANFGADLNVADMIHGRVVRSPHAHAKIKSINVKKALALPGVKAVITAADFPELGPGDIAAGEVTVSFHDMSLTVIARKKALYDGHAIAAVAATTPEIAARAAELIEVEYQVLKPVMTWKQAMDPTAPLLHEGQITKGVKPAPEKPSNVAARSEFALGDLAAGFAEAEVIVEHEFSTETVHQGYIEPHACVASMSADGMATVWASSQGQFMVRAYVAKLCGMDISKIKVIPAEIGGGFGGKTVVYLEPLAVALAKKSGRPVKMVMTRDEVFRATGPTSGGHGRCKIGAKKDGTITAADLEMEYEAGAFPGSPVMLGCMTGTTPYDIKNMRAVGYDVVVNRPKAAAYRAPGAPVAAFIVESTMDMLADKLGMCPLELRLKNAAKEGTKAPYGPKFLAIGYEDTLLAAKASKHWNTPLGPNQGRGIASGFWFNIGGNSSASVALNEDGTVIVVEGNPDIGGSRASMAMMTAEVLGIDVSRVKPLVADTESVPYSDLTGGSRVTFATGKAVVEAAQDVVKQLRQRAAKIWEVDIDQVEWKDGMAVAIETDKYKPLSIADIARMAGKTGGPISGKANINAAGAGPGFGTHICDVEVDPETGYVKVLRYTAIQDVGTAIHPSYVEGQLQGGAAQGIGWALNEEYVYSKEGNLLNTGFLDYRVPVASDLPMIDAILVECPNPGHPYGVRGVGEVPIVPPLAAVANAVSHAIGKRVDSLPISPPKLLAKIQSKG
ncbi:MAG: xanthine dehydrogenase family protein molybdopterin-binding subunit [Gammaproteobacteria bacterium]|nr:xanthine dehydrogenase family protein molybdopterin-binding subunit [Gammaproteobacteria bacterium]